MVFIYGGGFMFGTGEMYPGYGLAVQGDVVVVNLNYRVSSLGWFSTGNVIQECYTVCQERQLGLIANAKKVYVTWELQTKLRDSAWHVYVYACVHVSWHMYVLSYFVASSKGRIVAKCAVAWTSNKVSFELSPKSVKWYVSSTETDRKTVP